MRVEARKTLAALGLVGLGMCGVTSCALTGKVVEVYGNFDNCDGGILPGGTDYATDINEDPIDNGISDPSEFYSQLDKYEETFGWLKRTCAQLKTGQETDVSSNLVLTLPNGDQFWLSTDNGEWSLFEK